VENSWWKILGGKNPAREKTTSLICSVLFLLPRLDLFTYLRYTSPCSCNAPRRASRPRGAVSIHLSLKRIASQVAGDEFAVIKILGKKSGNRKKNPSISRGIITIGNT
jgi:hypothetical protein